MRTLLLLVLGIFGPSVQGSFAFTSGFASSTGGGPVPNAVTNVVVTGCSLAGNFAACTVTWSNPSGTVTGSHVRIVPGGQTPPVWPADYGDGYLYHQSVARTSDVDTLPLVDSTLVLQAAVRACDATGCGTFGLSPTFTIKQFINPPPPPPPPPPPIVTTVIVRPGGVGMFVGDNQILYAVPVNSLGQVSSLTPTWTSSNPAVATVGSTTGLVTGVGAGWDTVTASAGGVSGTSVINIGARPLPVMLNAASVSFGGNGLIRWPFNLSTGMYALTFADSTGAVIGHGLLTVTSP